MSNPKVVEDESDEGERLATGTVARGRTISVADTRGKKVFTGYHPDNQEPMFTYPSAFYSEGQTIELEESEIARFKELGFIVDPNKIAPEPQKGPKYERAA